MFNMEMASSSAAAFPECMESLDYSMKFPKRGKCYIFNHKIFEKSTGLSKRKGTDVDANNLYVRFKNLQFDVQLFTDKSVSKVMKKLKKAGKENHADESCFVCCILTHGDKGILYGKDGTYPTRLVFEPFKEDVCPTLAGKPKIFFIQACQGDQAQSGVDIVCKEYFDSVDGEDDDFNTLTDPDFLIGYSTIPGFLSWRNTERGSWFMQALCWALWRYGKIYDFMTLLTIVNRKVAIEFESNVPNDIKKHKKKQMPYIISTLTKNVRFPS